MTRRPGLEASDGAGSSDRNFKERKNTIKTLRISILFYAAILFIGSASAQTSASPTITLNVPLQLNDLHPDVALIHVVGTAYNDAGSHIMSAEGEVNVQVPRQRRCQSNRIRRPNSERGNGHHQGAKLFGYFFDLSQKRQFWQPLNHRFS